nr:AMP-binding protein [Saccharofermentans sp.]
VGGAAINPSILQFFKDIGINAIQGYGLTECSPILAVNRDVISKNESAGLPVPGVEVKVANPDEEGIGEFIAKGPNIFMGYYHDPDATAASFDENGYYLTGDLGYIDKDGFVIITGRKKNVIITKNGKNVFPEEIEYLLSLNQIVQESVVSSKFDEKKDDDVIIATIFPNMEEIESRLGSSPSEDKIQELLEEAVEEVNEKLVHYKRVKSVVYRPTEFEKNTSRKIKRY